MDETRALQQMEILNLGQLLNLVTNETKVKIRTLEKLHKSLITNAYGIIFDRTHIYKQMILWLGSHPSLVK